MRMKSIVLVALAKRGIVGRSSSASSSPRSPRRRNAAGRAHAISFYEIRFRTFPEPDLETGNPGFTSDIKEIHVHGPMTHLDALCHASYRGKWYNGYPLSQGYHDDVGCTKLGTEAVRQGIVTPGILVDMTRLGNPSRAPGARAFIDDLEAWERQTGLKVSPGDALFVYNAPAPKGQVDRRSLEGAMGISVLPWMKARGVSVTSSIAWPKPPPA
jgi:hypothetical protein